MGSICVQGLRARVLEHPSVTGLSRRRHSTRAVWPSARGEISMKLLITTAALALLAVSAPAAAQPTQPAAPQQSGGIITHKPKLSNEAAAKAIVDLQTAIQKNDTASIPAKVAAAKAAAKTADERYAIALLEVKAAGAAKDEAAVAA